MIELFTAPSPNGWKISIMLEECGLPYQVQWIDLLKGDQYRPDFLVISPNNRIPAVVDHAPVDGGAPLSVFETGAILCYLADKCAMFLSTEVRERTKTLEWLFWQVGGLGPMLGQHGHFKFYASERIAYATERYRSEALRLYSVLDRQLSRGEYVAGKDYSIADMACFPWVQTHKAQEIELSSFPHLSRWYQALKQRPALRRGMELGRELLKVAAPEDPEGRDRLFGLKNAPSPT